MKNNLTIIVTLILATLAALYLGTTIASGDIVTLSGWGGVVVLIVYLVKGHEISWQSIFFIAWGNISFLLAFRISPLHASSLIFGLFVLSCLLRGSRLPTLPPMGKAGVSGLKFSIIIFLVYGLLHLGISKVMPAIPGEFSWGNSTKAYFKAYFPVLILLFGLSSSIGFQVKSNWVKTFLIVLLVAVVGNNAYLVYLYLNGFSASSNAASFEEIGVLHIPLINALPHHFAMRSLGPLAVLFAFGFVTIPGWFRKQSVFLKLVVVVIIVGGLAGATMSGGRAAVPMCMFFAGCVAVYRRKIGMILVSIIGITLLVVLANIFSSVINDKAPQFVARPLQLLMLEKGDSMRSIESSRDQRGALFDAAIDEWKSTGRNMLIGRGVYRYKDNLKLLKSVVGEQESFVIVNLRAGTCHALIPSALIQYGALGFGLYLLVWFFLLRFNWKLYRQQMRQGYSQEVSTVTLCLFFYNCLRLFIDLIAAGWITIFVVILLILIRSRMAFELDEFRRIKASEPSVKTISVP